MVSAYQAATPSVSHTDYLDPNRPIVDEETGEPIRLLAFDYPPTSAQLWVFISSQLRDLQRRIDLAEEANRPAMLRWGRELLRIRNALGRNTMRWKRFRAHVAEAWSEEFSEPFRLDRLQTLLAVAALANDRGELDTQRMREVAERVKRIHASATGDAKRRLKRCLESAGRVLRRIELCEQSPEEKRRDPSWDDLRRIALRVEKGIPFSGPAELGGCVDLGEIHESKTGTLRDQGRVDRGEQTAEAFSGVEAGKRVDNTRANREGRATGASGRWKQSDSTPLVAAATRSVRSDRVRETQLNLHDLFAAAEDAARRATQAISTMRSSSDLLRGSKGDRAAALLEERRSFDERWHADWIAMGDA